MTGAAIFRIDAAMRGNKVIYWLGRIPLIKGLVSDALYEAHEGKLALTLLLWLWRIVKNFGGKVLYLALACVLPLFLPLEPEEVFSGAGFGRFCWLFLWLSFVVGPLLDPFAVKADPLKYTCVRMMGMDARRFHLVQGTAAHLEQFIPWTVWLASASALFGQGVWPGALLSVELACARLAAEWFHVWTTTRLKKSLFGRAWFTLVLIFGGLAAAYIPAMAFPLDTHGWLPTPWMAAVLLAAGAGSAVMLARYPRWYRLTLDTCTAERVSSELAKKKNSAAQFSDVQLKDSDFTVEEDGSQQTGWAYFQELFFRRHRRMMYKPVGYVLIGAAALTLAGGGALLWFRSGETAEVFTRITVTLPYCVFFLYFIQSTIIGTRICKAMFYNCDLAMLKFGWYRQPAVILKNFVLRFRRLCGVNLAISGAVCAMFTVLTLCAGGRPPLADYIAFLTAILCLGVFFSVHSLGVYYLFQPYTSDLQVKNPFFNIINTVMYLVCYACIQIRSTPTWFTPVVLAVTVAYSAVILFGVWRRAPRAFRVK